MPKTAALMAYRQSHSEARKFAMSGRPARVCLQGNKVSRIQNLEHLVNLESFELAANRIADFKDLQRLAHLPALRTLSLVDPDHGTNPIAKAEGYRHFVLCTLKQVHVLDGVPVSIKRAFTSRRCLHAACVEF